MGNSHSQTSQPHLKSLNKQIWIIGPNLIFWNKSQIFLGQISNQILSIQWKYDIAQRFIFNLNLTCTNPTDAKHNMA